MRASDNATGFRGVKHGERRSKPFQALVWRNGKMQHLGRYATAEEAALAYARELGPEDSKTAAAEAEPAMTAEQVEATQHSAAFKQFLVDVRERYEQALQQNETVDVFQDDFATLAEDEAGLGNKSDSELRELSSLFARSPTLERAGSRDGSPNSWGSDKSPSPQASPNLRERSFMARKRHNSFSGATTILRFKEWAAEADPAGRPPPPQVARGSGSRLPMQYLWPPVGRLSRRPAAAKMLLVAAAAARQTPGGPGRAELARPPFSCGGLGLPPSSYGWSGWLPALLGAPLMTTGPPDSAPHLLGAALAAHQSAPGPVAMPSWAASRRGRGLRSASPQGRIETRTHCGG